MGGKLYKTSPSRRYTLRRDGYDQLTGTETECRNFIHQNAPYSVEHAIRHKGWSMRPVEQEEMGSMPLILPEAQSRQSASDYYMVLHNRRRVFPGTDQECREYIGRDSGTSTEAALASGRWEMVPLPLRGMADDPAWRVDHGWPWREEGPREGPSSLSVSEDGPG